jgi:protein SERAC1
MSKESVLLAVGNTENAARRADIVFVHGLKGDERATWTSGGGFFPSWIAEDFPDCGVWSLGYEANFFKDAMAIDDRATNLLAYLTVKGIGKRPVVFVVHSLGGLLVKNLLRQAVELKNARWLSLPKETKGVVFLATPHTGSDIAGWIKFLPKVFSTSETVDELAANDPSLRMLQEWYRNNALDLRIGTAAYFETQGVLGIAKIVDESSANPFIHKVTPIGLDADHLNISKPRSKTSSIYEFVASDITEFLKPDFQ